MSLNNVKKVLSNLGWEFKITYKDKTIQSENYLKMTRTKIGNNIFKYRNKYYENKQKNIKIKKVDSKLDYLEDVTSYFKYISVLKRDKLTGLATRQDLEEFLSKLERTSVFVLCDIDDFKNVNDSYGHKTGDQVLSMLGKIINENIGANDFAGRYGGEEFLIIFATDNTSIVKRRIDKINKMFNINSNSLNLSFSAGISIYNKDKTIHETIEEADVALYYIKKNGKNNSAIYNRKMKK